MSPRLTVAALLARMVRASLLVCAIKARDSPVAQGCVLPVSLIYVGVNTLADLAYLWIDPRIGSA